MSIMSEVQRCSILEEFTKEQQKEYFSLSDKKVIHNIDTLYYSVFLDEFKDKPNIEKMLSDLAEMKEKLCEDRTLEFVMEGLTFMPRNFAMYSLGCLHLENMYDIFFTSHLPNDDTPRIIVQLRSVGLWLDGAEEMVEMSCQHLGRFLATYNLKIQRTQENRIDYAYHTNCIQNTLKYLTIPNLKKCVETKFTKWCEVGTVGKKEWTIDYLSLGMRKSKCIFFRCYNKTKEVIEMNYKSFFIEYWHKAKLISDFDKYCLEYAYKKKSVNALIEGRCRWYLEYGTDEKRKKEIAHLLGVCVHESDNYEHLAKQIKNVIPEVTVVMNVEYQTLRKFYTSMDDSIKEWGSRVPESDLLGRIYKILENRKVILDYLTTHSVSFKSAWWKRVQSCKVGKHLDSTLIREYISNIEKQKIELNILKSIATLSIYENQTNDFNLNEDFENLISHLNDNDVCKPVFIDTKTGEQVVLQDKEAKYDIIKSKKNKQLKSIVERG